MKGAHLIGAVALGLPCTAMGYGAGVFGFSGKPPTRSCTECHGGGATPQVTLTGPSTLGAGAQGKYVLDIVTGASNARAGFNVATTDGTLATVAQPNESWINSGELTHTKNWPKGKTIQVGFTLTAPGAPGTVRLYATALGSDGIDDPGGDGVASVFADVQVVAITSAGDLGPDDLLAAPPDLDVITRATEVKPTPGPDLGPPKDEPRWSCACEVGGAAADPPHGVILLVAALGARLRWSRRRRSWRSPTSRTMVSPRSR